MHLSQLLPLTYLLHTTTTFLDSSSFVIVLALSFFKAFDSVRHSAVLEKYSRLNIPDNIYSWIESFLQDYSHITEFDNDVSARNVDRMAGMSCATLSSVSSCVCVVMFSGIVMAMTAGLLFGLNFTPVIYIQQHHEQYPTASSNGN